MQKYLLFPYDYFLLVVLPFGGVTVVNSVLQITPKEKIKRIKTR
jgi:hypothetical protein